MNLFSKVTLLVTLLSVPFAGFAMDNAEQEVSNVWKYLGIGALALGALVTYKYVISSKKPTVDASGEQKAPQGKATQQTSQTAVVALNAAVGKNTTRNPQVAQQPVQKQVTVASETKEKEAAESTSLLGGLLGKFSSAKGDAAKVEKFSPAVRSKLMQLLSNNNQEKFDAYVKANAIDVTWDDCVAWGKTQSK